MAIDDHITDDKLQCNINREASKISTLSTNKFNKYEYLTGEEILPSNEKQMIEQGKITYSPLGKAFKKQTKTIEDQGEKQIKAIQNQGQVKTIKKYTYDDEDSQLISKQREIFHKPVDKRLDQITKLDEKVNHDLICRYKGKTSDENFTYDNALILIDKIKNGKIKLADVKNDQIKFKSNLGEIKRGHNKSKQQKNALYNIEMLYKARNEVIKFYDDYALVTSEAKNKTSGKGLKITTPRQLLQRLPIALAQVKATNNSEGLLNEIRQIVYSLYQSNLLFFASIKRNH